MAAIGTGNAINTRDALRRFPQSVQGTDEVSARCIGGCLLDIFLVQDGETALHLAAYYNYGQAECIAPLLEAGASVNERSKVTCHDMEI